MEFLKESVDYFVFGILGLMGFITVWLTAERLIFLRTLDPKEYDTQDAYDKALTDHLTTLYIIYSNAPYVGLLGTVLGIMITFYDMGTTGNINAGEIMTGLSLALKATALGLAVAIPTLIVYNGLQRKINVLSTNGRKRTRNDRNSEKGAAQHRSFHRHHVGAVGDGTLDFDFHCQGGNQDRTAPFRGRGKDNGKQQSPTGAG